MYALRRLLRRGRIADEHGFALVLALGVTVVLSMVLVTVVDSSWANERTARFSSQASRSYWLANAGINDAASVLMHAANPLDPTLLPSTTTSYDGGTVTWSGTLDQANLVWSITATASTRNPTGVNATPVRKVLTAQVSVTPQLVQSYSDPAWNYIILTATGHSCDETLSANVAMNSPLYVLGNLCFGNGSTIAAGPLVVKGQVTMANSSNSIGSSSKPISEAHIVGGCQYWKYSLHNPCQYGAGGSGGDNVWATILDATPPAITVPVPDWDGWYANAMPGPKYPCYAAKSSAPSTWPVFDNNTLRDNSVSPAFNLTPTSSSYDCWTAGGELKWDSVAKQLTMNGTAFIDGSAYIGTTGLVTYTGHGTIYLSGTFLMNSNTYLCATSAGGTCDNTPGHWDPNQNMLTFVTNGSGGQVPTGDGIQLASSAQFQGGLFATYNIDLGAGVNWEGPMVGGTLSLGSGCTLYPFAPTTSAPVGLPGTPVVYAKANPAQNYSG